MFQDVCCYSLDLIWRVYVKMVMGLIRKVGTVGLCVCIFSVTLCFPV